MTPELSTTGVKRKRNAWKLILTAGLLAAVLDGLAASISTYLVSGNTPDVVFKFVASGVFGKESFSGGSVMVLAGIFFHTLIACTWAFIYFQLFIRIPSLRKNWVVNGIAYGAMVWVVMNFVVIPLSNTPAITMTMAGSIRGMLILMVCIGLPIAFLVGKFYAHDKDFYQNN